MLLAIDVGNTNTKFAVHDGKTWRGQWRASTDPRRTADEYAPWLAQILALPPCSRFSVFRERRETISIEFGAHVARRFFWEGIFS